VKHFAGSAVDKPKSKCDTQRPVCISLRSHVRKASQTKWALQFITQWIAHQVGASAWFNKWV